MRFYIAGAHSRGATLGHYLTYLDKETEIIAYLYDNDELNPTIIGGVPVLRIDENSALDCDAVVYLATRGVNHAHLRNTLTKCGMTKIIPVDVSLDMNIRNRYLRKYYEAMGRKYIKIGDLPLEQKTEINDISFQIYVANSIFDSELQIPCLMPYYEKKIQVGSSLTDIRIDNAVYDNDGENISSKNKQFCELTGLYWIWKNAKEDVVGLSHYRRHFIMPDKWQNRMLQNNVDVILPVPLYVTLSIKDNYCDRHIPEVWECMMDYLREYFPEDFSLAESFFSNNGLYSPCNMFVMKKEILNQLCSWMFPILFAVNDKIGTIDDKYQNRYPGFLAERLMTYYFERNKDKYNIVYADKNFLS